jgi:processive 1,2-diacylglycerol beta-glucosyltransferase
MTKETILILYSNYGDGHRQAAKALRDTLAMTQHNMEGILVDFMELTHPHVYPMSRYLFIQAMKKSPSIYGYIFNKTRDVNSFSNLMKKFNGLGLGRLLSFIQTARPSMVVSTFPLAAGAMSKLKEFGLGIPIRREFNCTNSYCLWAKSSITTRVNKESSDIQAPFTYSGIYRLCA